MWSYTTDDGDIAVAVEAASEEQALQKLNVHTDQTLVHSGEPTTTYDLSDGGSLVIGYFKERR